MHRLLGPLAHITRFTQTAGDSTRISDDGPKTQLIHKTQHWVYVGYMGDSTRIYKDDSTTWPKDSMALQHRLSLNNNGINKDESTKTNQQRRFSQNQQRRISKDESTKTNQSKSKFNRGIQLEPTKPNHLLGIN